METIKELKCPFCGQEVERPTDYEEYCKCACGADYWPDDYFDMAEGQGQYLDWKEREGKDVAKIKFLIVRHFDYLTDGPEIPATEFDEWALIFAKEE